VSQSLIPSGGLSGNGRGLPAGREAEEGADRTGWKWSEERRKRPPPHLTFAEYHAVDGENLLHEERICYPRSYTTLPTFPAAAAAAAVDGRVHSGPLRAVNAEAFISRCPPNDGWWPLSKLLSSPKSASRASCIAFYDASLPPLPRYIELVGWFIRWKPKFPLPSFIPPSNPSFPSSQRVSK